MVPQMDPLTVYFQVDEGDKPMTFTQSFTLVPSPETPDIPYFLCVTDIISFTP